jgi:hypothetical protein
MPAELVKFGEYAYERSQHAIAGEALVMCLNFIRIDDHYTTMAVFSTALPTLRAKFIPKLSVSYFHMTNLKNRSSWVLP